MSHIISALLPRQAGCVHEQHFVQTWVSEISITDGRVTSACCFSTCKYEKLGLIIMCGYTQCLFAYELDLYRWKDSVGYWPRVECVSNYLTVV